MFWFSSPPHQHHFPHSTFPIPYYVVHTLHTQFFRNSKLFFNLINRIHFMTFRTSRIPCCLPAMEQHSLYILFGIEHNVHTWFVCVFCRIKTSTLCSGLQKHFNGWSVWLFPLSVCPSRIWGWLRIRWAEDVSTYYYLTDKREFQSPAKCCFGFWFLWSTKYVCLTFIVVHCLPRSMIPLFYVVFHITNHNLTVINSSSPTKHSISTTQTNRFIYVVLCHPFSISPPHKHKLMNELQKPRLPSSNHHHIHTWTNICISHFSNCAQKLNRKSRNCKKYHSKLKLLLAVEMSLF